MAEDDVWPTRRKRLFRCCNLDNAEDLSSLIEEVCEDPSAPAPPPPGLSENDREETSGSEWALAHFINSATNLNGLYAFHVAAHHGAVNVLIELLDLDGLEAEPIEKKDRRTPLHFAIQYCNEKHEENVEWDESEALNLVHILASSPCDPAREDSTNRTPLDLCTIKKGDPFRDKLEAVIRDAVVAKNEAEQRERKQQMEEKIRTGGYGLGDVVVDDDVAGNSGPATPSDDGL
ncbi:MAG: hypothetical protein M1831_000305 [Alyxoria varia]|nr:MAG: hypothetical protein M1831_000305 [Alyxoria varia]